MQLTIVDWLDRVGSTAFAVSAWAFVLVNGVALLVLLRRRDARLVNRWTSTFLAGNLVLLGVGLGVPLVTLAARTAIVALTPAFHVMVPSATADQPLSEEPVRP
jgi:uncharacterized membrane protein